MTAPAASSDAHLTATTVLGRAMAGEWTRLMAVRSTWMSLGAAAAVMSLIGGAAGAGNTGGPAPIWVAAQVAAIPGQFLFLLVVILAATAEYSSGAIHSALQWVPRRPILFVARTLVPVTFVTATAVLVAVATDVVAWTLLGEAAEVVPAHIAASLGRITLVIAFGSLLAVGLGLLLRNTAATLTAIFLLIFALPVALGNSGVRWLIAISDHLPGRAIVSMLVVDEVELGPSTVAAVMIGWSVAALIAGGWSLIRRDAT